MANLTIEQIQKVVDRGFKEQEIKFDNKIDLRFKKQEESLKTFIVEQDEELARIINKAFDNVAQVTNAHEVRLQKVEKVSAKVAEALSL